MNIIGITGSSGAGKSTVCDIFKKKYNVEVINADDVARSLSKKGTNYIQEIVDKFGQEIVDEEGELKRKKLAEIIYTDSKKRKQLNDCTFKYIKKKIEDEIKDIKNVSAVIIDAPLLFECELNKLCNYVIGVISEKELQIQRIIKRDNVDKNYAERRLSAQEENVFYINKSDRIIKNNDDIIYIEKCIDDIAKDYNITKKLQ